MIPLLASLCVCVAVASAAAPTTKTAVTSLPGHDGDLPSDVFTGHIPAGMAPNGKGLQYMFYTLVESENDPANDPVVVWYQGGPGASSLFGLLVEFGPFLLNEDSLNNEAYNKTGTPQLIPNAYSWSKIANVIVVDNPAPVGFSYCEPEGPSGGGTSCGSWNDSYVATSNQKFIQGLVQEYPQWKDNKWFIAGESYAGVYVPVIVRALLDTKTDINLAGFAVGDGCIGTDVLCGSGNPQRGPFYDVEWLYGHSGYSLHLHSAIRSQCPEVDLLYGNLTDACNDLVKEMYTEVGGYWGYGFYDACEGQRSFKSSIFAGDGERQYWGPPISTHSPPALGSGLNGYACPGNALNLWLNRTDVRKALNVDPNSTFFSGDNGVGFNYTLTERNLLPFYQRAALETDLHVMLYFGDTDPGITSFRGQAIYFPYFEDNGVAKTKAWRPWTTDGGIHMGGYVVEFDGDVSFVTVRGAIHMVPESKPMVALAMLSKFLSGEELPPYVPQPPPA